MSDSQSSEPGLESPRCYRFEDWAFSFSPLTTLLTQLYQWVPGYRQWWKCEWFKVGLYFRRRQALCRAFTSLSNARESVSGVPVYTSHAGISARQRAPESAARRHMLQSSTVLNFRASRQQFSQSCTGVTVWVCIRFQCVSGWNKTQWTICLAVKTARQIIVNQYENGYGWDNHVNYI